MNDLGETNDHGDITNASSSTPDADDPGISSSEPSSGDKSSVLPSDRYIALTALLVSIVSLAPQLIFYLQGHDIRLFAPTQIILRVENDSIGNYIRVGARMAYVNSGHRDYSGLIEHESVRFAILSKVRQQDWHSIFRFSVPRECGLPDGCVYQDEYISEAHPIGIPGKASLSREVYFSPFPVNCEANNTSCDPFENFVSKEQLVEHARNNDTIQFVFTSRIFDKASDVETSCVVKTLEFLKLIEKNSRAEPPCYQ